TGRATAAPLARAAPSTRPSARSAATTAGKYAGGSDAIAIRGAPEKEGAAFRRMLARPDPYFAQ
ncbi:class II aldolase/adducin family protein, partial [Methylobacterium sp. J-077]|nr:class II aldolase/adducin family protein [Methylobacterium sp. J-077]